MHAHLDSELDVTEQARPQALWPSAVSRKLSAVPTSRNSIGIDIDAEYCRFALRRLDSESGPLFARAAIEYHAAADLLAPANVPAIADKPRKRKGR